MDDWYRPDSFEPGEIYVDADGKMKLEYAGIVTAKAARGLLAQDDQTIEVADDTEPVMVFLVVTQDKGAVVFYTHTKSDADRGYAFMSLADRRVDK